MNRRYPPRNLPGTSEDWGRAIEVQGGSWGQDLRRTAQQVNNGLRANSGQLAYISNQVEGLFERYTELAAPADLSVTGNNSTIPTATRTFSFSAPPVDATAFIEIYADWTPSSTTGICNLFAHLRRGAPVIAQLQRDPEQMQVNGWGDTVTKQYRAMQSVQVTAGVAPTFILTLFRIGFTSASTTETLSNIRSYLSLQGSN